MEKISSLVAELEAFPELVDPRQLSALIDRLQALLAGVVHDGVKRGDHLLEGRTPCGWVIAACRVSPAAAADRLRTGEQLRAMPRVAEAMRSGEIGYQSASVICRFRKLLREDLRRNIDEEWWVGRARESSVIDLGWLEEHTRYMVDPDSFDRQVEEDWEKRFLSISQSGGMYHLSGVLERSSGAALEAAIDALAKAVGEADARTPKQRRADALCEIVHHAMDRGTLPRRHGARPHLSIHTTPEGLRREAGTEPARLESGLPVSNKTAQRVACDGLVRRVVRSGSMVVDVGRAHRTAQPAQWRALAARHRTCAWPGCDRPLSWTQAHHVDFWESGGKTDIRKMLPLCFFHHRLVHEGGWQVVKAGDAYRFLPPDGPALTRRRWGEWSRAA